MLDRRVVEAVAQGRFHIYTAELASEGMELLTGLPFGALGTAAVTRRTRCWAGRRRRCRTTAAPARPQAPSRNAGRAP